MGKLSIGILCLSISVTCFAQNGRQVLYKTIDTVNLMMNIYSPQNLDPARNYPAMIFFYGGGWKDGTMKQFEPHARYFSNQGMVCFLAEYRVESRHHTSPFEALKDAKSAIRYLREHAGELNIDTLRIIAAGGSAGGHLAAATALISGFNDEKDNKRTSCIPSALVLFNPVFDNGPGGYGYERIGERYKDFSPLHNIRSNAPPTIVLLGTKDVYIPVETAKYFQVAMERAGNRCDLRLYEGEGHGFFNFAKGENYYKTVLEVHAFLSSLGYISRE